MSSSSRGRKDQPWVDLISGMYDDGVMDLPFSFILARRGDRNVLVDTGFMQDEHSSGFSAKFGIPYWISPLRMLAELGVAPGAITDIFVTPRAFRPHGLDRRIPERAYLHPEERVAVLVRGDRAAARGSAHLTAIIDPDNLRTALEASIEHRVTLVDGDKDNVLPGIHVAPRQRPHDRPAVRHHRNGARPAA